MNPEMNGEIIAPNVYLLLSFLTRSVWHHQYGQSCRIEVHQLYIMTTFPLYYIRFEAQKPPGFSQDLHFHMHVKLGYPIAASRTAADGTAALPSQRRKMCWKGKICYAAPTFVIYCSR